MPGRKRCQCQAHSMYKRLWPCSSRCEEKARVGQACSCGARGVRAQHYYVCLLCHVVWRVCTVPLSVITASTSPEKIAHSSP